MSSKKLLLFTKMNFGVAANGGIKKKVFAQAKAFRHFGLETDVLFFENKNIIIEGNNHNFIKNTKGKIDFLYFLYNSFLKQIKIENYNYVYIRHFLTNPLFIFLLWKMKKQNKNLKIYMEIPTFPYRFEFGHMALTKRIGLWLDDICTPFFHYYISKIITFSSKEEIYKIPTIKSDNGIDIDLFNLLEPAIFDGKTIHLLGLANVQPWHGFDRIINGLELYNSSNQLIKVVFHVVGSGGELENLKQLTIKNKLEDTVIFHGFLNGKELDNVFRKCHLGIGSCGMHRINVAKGETSALKSREFAARGLPFVIAYEDRGFPAQYPFLLELKADDTAINIDEIIDFYKKTNQTADYHQLMHNFAKENLTWESKLKVVAEAYLEN
jgi:glycosyltransferase involved in cell wall biosynthesis